MAKKKPTEKQAHKDAIKNMFPSAVEVMAAVLKDELKDKANKKVQVTGKMRLDVALRVVDQTIGRAPQAALSSCWSPTVRKPAMATRRR